MGFVRASREVSWGAPIDGVEAQREPPERLYVRCEQRGRVRLVVWGIEYGGIRSEVAEALAPGRPSAARAIERDLRRGVGLL